MTVPVGVLNYVVGGSISFVFSPNTSVPAYFEISKTALYDCNIVYNRALITSGSISVTFFVHLWNITTNTSVGSCWVYFNNINGGTSQTAVINNIFQLQSGNSYDIRLVGANNAAFTVTDAFTINIKEFIPLYS